MCLLSARAAVAVEVIASQMPIHDERGLMRPRRVSRMRARSFAQSARNSAGAVALLSMKPEAVLRLRRRSW